MKRRRCYYVRFASTIAVSAILSIAAASAQETVVAAANGQVDLTEVSLDTLMDFKVQSVYAASRYEQKISEAPSAVTIVDSDEIKLYGHRSLAEILRSVRGLYVTYDRNYSYLGMRGFNRPGDYNSRFLVLVDGHRVNENVFDSALIGNDFVLDVDMIDKVEVIRGPSSSVYGNNAFFGVINIITKTGHRINGLEASVSAGSFDTYKGRLTYGKRFTNDVELVLSGSYLTSEGAERLFYKEFDNPADNFGVTRNTDYESFYKAFGSISYHDLSLEGGYGSREKGIPTGSYGTIFGDDDSRTVDNRGFAVLKYERSFEEDWHVEARLSYDHYYYYGDYPVPYPSDPRVLYKDYARGSSWGAEAQVSRKLFDRHTLTGGAEFHHNFEQDQGNEDDFDPPTKYDDHRDTYNAGVYAQAEIMVLTNLILNSGVRYDHFETFGDTINPRVGLIYNPWEPTTLKLLYGTAFKAPNAYELYYAGPNNKQNTSLDPETIETYEVVLEQQFGKYFTASASGFYYEIDDLIDQQLDPTDNLLVYRNLDQVTAIGGEFEVEAKLPGGWRGRTSYTFQDATDESTGSRLSNSPRHLAKVNLIAPIYKDKVFSGLELQYSSTARTLRGNIADDHVVANWTLFSRHIIKGLELSVSIYNLFGQHYAFPGAGEHTQDTIEQDGRTFRVKLTYHF